MKPVVLAALAVLAVVLAIRRRARGKPRNPQTSRSATANHEPLIQQNHQDWKDAVYNPKEHRGERG